MELKGTVTIEKTTQACKDGTCGHVHEVPIEFPETKPQATIRLENMTTAEPTNTVKVVSEPQKPKNIIQPFIPAYNCPDGNCGEVHKNKNYRMRPKGKCTNCDQFARNDSGVCPWCGEKEIEPVDDETLDELGIPKAESYGHTDESE